MAKELRFPSDANRPKNAPKKVDAPEVQPVVGEKQNLVSVIYKRPNHHLLDHIYAITQCVNHVPVKLWEKAKSHPAVVAMLKSGDLKLADAQSEVQEKKADSAQVS